MVVVEIGPEELEGRRAHPNFLARGLRAATRPMDSAACPDPGGQRAPPVPPPDGANTRTISDM